MGFLLNQSVNGRSEDNGFCVPAALPTHHRPKVFFPGVSIFVVEYSFSHHQQIKKKHFFVPEAVRLRLPFWSCCLICSRSASFCVVFYFWQFSGVHFLFVVLPFGATRFSWQKTLLRMLSTRRRRRPPPPVYRLPGQCIITRAGPTTLITMGKNQRRKSK